MRKVKGKCLVNNKRIEGYEIHMGGTRPVKKEGMPYLRLRWDNKRWEDGWISEDGKVMGTYVHGIMDSTGFREDFLNSIRVKKGLKQKKARKTRLSRFKEYDKLAHYFERYCNMDRLFHVIGLNLQKQVRNYEDKMPKIRPRDEFDKGVRSPHLTLSYLFDK